MNDALYGALLERLGGGANAALDTDPLAQALVSELGADDPRSRMITLWLAQRQAVQAREPPIEVIEQLPRNDDVVEATAFDAFDAFPSGQVAEEPFERLRQMVDRMRTELQDLREHNDAAAAAVGACYLCWGETASCSLCRGRGQAGWLPPHAALYERLVVPAVRHLQHREALGTAQVPIGDAVERRQHRSTTTRRQS